MRLLAWELRKIWRSGILAAIVLLGAVYYWMFPEFYIEYFCNGPASQAQFQLASEWVEKYGPTLEPEERAELDGQLAEEIRTFDQQIAAIPEAAAVGLTDYETFSKFRENYYSGTAASGGEAIWTWNPWFTESTAAPTGISLRRSKAPWNCMTARKSTVPW